MRALPAIILDILRQFLACKANTSNKKFQVDEGHLHVSSCIPLILAVFEVLPYYIKKDQKSFQMF